MTSGEPVDDPESLFELFGRDVAVHIYALADLEEPFWSASRWWRAGDAALGIIELPEGGGTVVYAVSSRDPEGSLDLLAQHTGDIPAGALVTAPLGMGEVISAVREMTWNRTYHRYVLDDPERVGPPEIEMVDLGRAHVDELADLYDRASWAAFWRPAMLDQDTFVGVRRDGRLVAAAGTHVIAERASAAAIGSVVTDPDWRRRGLAREATRGVCRRLRGRVDTIGLNCADANDGARRLYEGLGFRAALGYEEAELR